MLIPSRICWDQCLLSSLKYALYVLFRDSINCLIRRQFLEQKLRDATHIQELEDERDKLKHAVRKLRDRVKNSDKVHKAEQMDAEIKFLQGTIEWAERTSEVQRSLEEVQQKLSVERAKVQSSNMTIEKLEAEMKQWRASCNRYKKKVSDCALHLMRSY